MIANHVFLTNKLGQKFPEGPVLSFRGMCIVDVSSFCLHILGIGFSLLTVLMLDKKQTLLNHNFRVRRN